MRERDYLMRLYKGEELESALTRLESGEPLQTIVKNVDFYGYQIDVEPGILVPTLETEQFISKIITNLGDFTNPRMADIGTGSGCIAIALEREIPCTMEAVDISKKALSIAKENAIRNDSSVRFLEGSLLEPLLGKYDCIVSNPPYISFSPDVLEVVANAEPRLAQYAGESGLGVYDVMLKDCKEHLNTQFLLAFEIGDNQSLRIIEKINKYLPGSRIWVEKDMNGKERFLFVREG